MHKFSAGDHVVTTHYGKGIVTAHFWTETMGFCYDVYLLESREVELLKEESPKNDFDINEIDPYFTRDDLLTTIKEQLQVNGINGSFFVRMKERNVPEEIRLRFCREVERAVRDIYEQVEGE